MNKSSIPLRLFMLLCAVGLAGVAIAQARAIEVPMVYAPALDEQLPDGPSALRAAADGTFWIVNPVDNTITNVDRTNQVLRQFRLDDAVGIADVSIAADGEMTVLDAAAQPQALLTVSADGSVRGRKEVRAPRHLLQQTPEDGHDDELKPLAASALSLEWTGQSTFDRWRIRAGTDTEPDATLVHDATTITIEAGRGVVRGVRILRETSEGVFVLTEEVAGDDTIVVDATVRFYARSGELRGIGRIPLTDQYAHVESPAAVTDDGRVYFLSTKPYTAAVVELPMEVSLPEILPERGPRNQELDALRVQSNSVTPPITRAQMEANAHAYFKNSTYYPASALTGYCPGRTAPRYLGTAPRVISSVPYDWGGYDSIADFNRMIAAGSVAGDIHTSGVESCSRGVDCSGFITRVWGLPLDVKKSTCSLSDVSTQITQQSLLKGDILTLCGKHVAMFLGLTSTGVHTIESTTSYGLDRVAYVNSSWSRFNGYTPRRYVNVTNSTTSTPSHVRSDFTPASGGIGTVATFSSTWQNTDDTPMTAWITVRSPYGTTYDYVMSYISGQTTSGALFKKAIQLPWAGRWDYAVTVTSTTTGRSARYPSSGYASGPWVNNVSYSVSPTWWVCGQSPVTIRVGAYNANATTVRFVVTKANAWCGLNGSFLANGVVDLRVDGPWGGVVTSASYYAGAPQVTLDVVPWFTSGSRNFYATIRNQGYWAGPITIRAH